MGGHLAMMAAVALGVLVLAGWSAMASVDGIDHRKRTHSTRDDNAEPEKVSDEAGATDYIFLIGSLAFAGLVVWSLVLQPRSIANPTSPQDLRVASLQKTM